VLSKQDFKYPYLVVDMTFCINDFVDRIYKQNV